MSDARLHLSYLENYGLDRDKYLNFLYDLERMGLICSKLEIRINRIGTERVWYPITEKENAQK